MKSFVKFLLLIALANCLSFYAEAQGTVHEVWNGGFSGTSNYSSTYLATSASGYNLTYTAQIIVEFTGTPSVSGDTCQVTADVAYTDATSNLVNYAQATSVGSGVGSQVATVTPVYVAADTPFDFAAVLACEDQYGHVVSGVTESWVARVVILGY
jgi:hypothetical protein